MLLAATWVDLEIIILSEVSQKRTTLIYLSYMWDLKKDINELIYETEIGSLL